eukprot:NODE_6333_length_636_cov_4.124361_g5394_i0.p1 GENE.NODE_6333_length_636_cov_4.124361_g5394_i0~~NODE_6333_length_636_cov_4.124361_g5394_i0.p1  ORF type:complete len:143 (+),score=7.12 NODE_6333_length_636_cov_4.124361_g5394_i0:70-498(+)
MAQQYPAYSDPMAGSTIGGPPVDPGAATVQIPTTQSYSSRMAPMAPPPALPPQRGDQRGGGFWSDAVAGVGYFHRRGGEEPETSGSCPIHSKWGRVLLLVAVLGVLVAVVILVMEVGGFLCFLCCCRRGLCDPFRPSHASGK